MCILFFFSRSNLHLSTSVLIILFFLHLLCHVCFWCRYLLLMDMMCVCGAVQMFIANFLIYFSHTLTLYYTTYACAYCIYLFTNTHSLTHTANPLRDTDTTEYMKSHRILQWYLWFNWTRMWKLTHGWCVRVCAHAILLCINTTCTAIIIILVIK